MPVLPLSLLPVLVLVLATSFAALVTSIARNPAARGEVFGIGILGFALTEAIALFALVVALLLLFAL